MIIGISGKKQHGKDTVADIIQCLTAGYNDKEIIDVLTKKHEVPDYHLLPFADETTWEKKQFAGKLKQIVCLLIGCDMKQLEDNAFKEKELGPQWEVWYVSHYKLQNDKNHSGRVSKLCATREEAQIEQARISTEVGMVGTHIQHQILTPRRLLQLVGTDGGRDIVHPQIWVNATMADYKWIPNPNGITRDMVYPNWIITDCRFPNEAEAIKAKEGIVIRVNRPGMPEGDKHPSETSLDDYKKFDWVFSNNSNLTDLILKVKTILDHYAIKNG